MDLSPYSIEQQRHVEEALDLMSVLAPLRAESRDLVGGMQWKTIRGHEYLYRYAPDPVTKKKKSTSLGRRTPETEAVYHRFIERRDRVKGELPRLEEMAATQTRVAKALRLGRISRATGDFLSILGASDLAAHLVLVGDFAAYGYETVLLHEMPVRDSPAPEFLLQDDFIAGELLAELRKLFPDLTARTRANGAVTFAAGDTEFTVWSRVAWMDRLEQRSDDARRLACIEHRLDERPMGTIVFDRAGRPAQVSVPDPLAFSMIACLRGDELGPELAEIAVATGKFELEEHEADAFPEIATRIGGFGLRI